MTAQQIIETIQNWLAGVHVDEHSAILVMGGFIAGTLFNGRQRLGQHVQRYRNYRRSRGW